MRLFSICFTILLFCACVGPFAGRKKSTWLSSPPRLQVRFDSVEAAARLRWGRAPRRGFLRYELQRSEGSGFVARAEFESVDDTSFVDEGLQANVGYRYRVLSYFEEEETVQALSSAAVEGGIHRFTNAWRVGGEEEFLPTRLVVDPWGVVSVVGVGSGRVARFDRAGNPLRELIFTSEPLACLETSTLDGPTLALDSEDCLYVVYNVRQESSSPQAYWSKFGPQGRLLWTRPLKGLFARHIVVGDDDQIFIESISQLQQFDTDGERQTRYIVPALLVSSLRLWTGKFAALIEPVTLVEGDWQAPRLVVYDSVQRQTAGLVIGRDPTSPEDRGSGLLLRPTDFVVDETSFRSFVVNAGQGRIEVFRKDRFLTRWGQKGSGPGEFRFAGRIAVIDDMTTGRTTERQVVAGGIAKDREGYIYVADTFNDRIQKFQP